jgi:predicted AAA+ superfamily ATPase
LGNDAGVSHNTIKEWLSVLESSFIIQLLPPYFENYKKRVVKAPKLYFYDTGLLCHLLGIDTAQQIQYHFLKGALMENFVFAELIKSSYNKLKFADVYYWRDKTGNEVDFLIPGGAVKKIIEVKAGKTINSDFFKGLNYFRSIHKGHDKLQTYLAFGGSQEYTHLQTKVMSLENIGSIV